MLKVLRDNLKYLSWILWIVILVFIVFVFVDFGGGLRGRQQRSASAATVGGEPIGQREFEREYRRLENQYRQAFGGRWNSQLAEQMQLPRRALERLVDRRLLADEAARQGLSVSDADVQRAILQFPALQSAGGGFVGEEEYLRFLRAYGYTAQEFESSVRQDLLIQRFSALLDSGVAIPDAELEKTWRARNEKAEIRYVLAPALRFIGQAKLDDAAIAAYFDAHQEVFRMPDRRAVDYLLVDEAKLRATVTVDRAELEREYAAKRDEFEQPEQVHARHILIKVDDKRPLAEARQAMVKIRARLAAGESFEKLAGELSEDPGSKARGGDLGFFGRGQMVPAFEDAAFGAEPGQIVGPIETTFGLHLIQVLERSAARTQPLAEVEGRLRTELAAEKSGPLAESRAKSLAARIRDEKPKDEAAWKALADGDQILFLSTAPFGKDDVVPGIGRNAEFAAAAFALAPGEASAPVQVARGWAILRLRESLPAHMPTLDEVRDKVRSAAERERAGQLATASLERAKAALASGRSFDEVAKSLELEPRDSGEFTRQAGISGLAGAEAVVDAAMQLPAGAVGGPVATGQGAVLFRVTSRVPFDAARFAAERETLRDELRRTEANRLLASLLARRREEAGVRYDPQLAERLGLAPRTS